MFLSNLSFLSNKIVWNSAFIFILIFLVFIETELDQEELIFFIIFIEECT